MRIRAGRYLNFQMPQSAIASASPKPPPSRMYVAISTSLKQGLPHGTHAVTKRVALKRRILPSLPFRTCHWFGLHEPARIGALLRCAGQPFGDGVAALPGTRWRPERAGRDAANTQAGLHLGAQSRVCQCAFVIYAILPTPAIRQVRMSTGCCAADEI